ncbi:MAG: hypothetical protein ACYC7E_15670 [Armatimonadota bacterium]
MATKANLITRREFLRSLGRYLALGVLVGGTGALALRRDPEKCVNRGICSGCSSFTDCGLPQALSAKQAKVNAK